MAVEALNEITEDSSTEDVKAYAEKVVQEVASERAGDQKTDAQIISGTAGKPAEETHADVHSGSEAAEVKDQGDDSGVEEPSWLDDDLKADAAAFGITEAELSDFASRDEVERALKLFDKAALEAGRKALADGPARNEKGQFAKKDEQQDEPDPKPDDSSNGRYKVSLDTELFDDEIVGEFTRLRDHFDARLQALEAHYAEAEAEAKERHFDSLVDTLGHADLFGKTDNESPEEKQRREDLFVEVETYLRGREALGRPAQLSEAIVSRIARSLFANEIGKKELKARTRKISRQSNGRMGGGATRPQDPREDPRSEFDRLYRELERA